MDAMKSSRRCVYSVMMAKLHGKLVFAHQMICSTMSEQREFQEKL